MVDNRYALVNGDDSELEESNNLSEKLRDAFRNIIPAVKNKHEGNPRKAMENYMKLSAMANLDIIVLSHDCYAIAVAENVTDISRVLVPLAAASIQVFILYTIAFTNENIFDGGHWLEPVSEHLWLNVVRLLSIVVAFFKVWTELNDAQRLCWCLLVGSFPPGVNRRQFGWWALGLQYFTSLFTLFVSFSTILSGQSYYMCIVKIFSIFVVVDIDNLVGEFFEALWKIDFVVFADSELMCAHEGRKRLVGGSSQCSYLRACFLLMPTLMLAGEAYIAINSSALPVTILVHGYVSNVGAPVLLSDLEDCCPPIPHDTFLGGKMSASYSVLVLSPKEEPAPEIFWVALPARPEPKRPSSLQVVDRRDANALEAFQAGFAQTVLVQARYWLQAHNFSHKVYGMLRLQEQMYDRYVPHVVNFTVNDLHPFGFSYRIFVTAQNPRTKALAENPIVSAKIVTPMCALYCEKCELLGPGHCDKCAEGAIRTKDGLCKPCTRNCKKCDELSVLADGTLQCNRFGCANGYGADGHGGCKNCGVRNCLYCDFRKSTATIGKCDICEDGYGLSHNGTCLPCAHKRCNCEKPGKCDSCIVGWGLLPNYTCIECPEGCADCTVAEESHCLGCTEGFVSVDSFCEPCPLHCQNCSISGPGHCDRCRDGFGYSSKTHTCHECTLANCLECTAPPNPKCVECERGFGVAPDGACETCGKYCERCDWAGKCSACAPGYAVYDGACWSCADGCVDCASAGPARCDQCMAGFQFDNVSRICVLAGSTEM